MDHRKLVQQRLGEPGSGARGGRRQEREQRGAGGGEGGGLREPCLKIPFHRQLLNFFMSDVIPLV